MSTAYRQFQSRFRKQGWSLETAAAAWQYQKATGVLIQPQDTGSKTFFEAHVHSTSHALAQAKRTHPNQSLKQLAALVQQTHANPKHPTKFR